MLWDRCKVAADISFQADQRPRSGVTKIFKTIHFRGLFVLMSGGFPVLIFQIRKGKLLKSMKGPCIWICIKKAPDMEPKALHFSLPDVDHLVSIVYPLPPGRVLYNFDSTQMSPMRFAKINVLCVRLFIVCPFILVNFAQAQLQTLIPNLKGKDDICIGNLGTHA